jgi:hypothetical protein
VKYEAKHENVENGEKPKLNFNIVESPEQVLEQNPNGEKSKDVQLNFGLVFRCNIERF